jgi:hypothetical protein
MSAPSYLQMARDRVQSPAPDNRTDPGSTAAPLLWERLLTMAEDLDGHEPVGLCGALRGLRSLGAVLVRGEHGWRLEASPGYWTTAEEWTADTDRWLMPHVVALRALLATLPNRNQVATATTTTQEVS